MRTWGGAGLEDAGRTEGWRFKKECLLCVFHMLTEDTKKITGSKSNPTVEIYNFPNYQHRGWDERRHDKTKTMWGDLKTQHRRCKVKDLKVTRISWAVGQHEQHNRRWPLRKGETVGHRRQKNIWAIIGQNVPNLMKTQKWQVQNLNKLQAQKIRSKNKTTTKRGINIKYLRRWTRDSLRSRQRKTLPVLKEKREGFQWILHWLKCQQETVD